MQVRSTHQISSRAVQASETTGRSIEALSQVVGEINGVTKMITDIARQTSLLAINAGVEASRSGQDGKGFAVIAMEVKSLSEQTSAATSKITDLVRQVHASTGTAVTAVAEIAKAIDGVNSAATRMSSAVEEQVQITHQIAASVVETAGATADVTDRMQQVATEASRTGDQASDVDRMCTEVAEHVRALQATLVKIVRTCSAEIDRRQTARHSVRLPARVIAGTRSFDVIVEDLSMGGARMRGNVPTEGEMVLRIQGMPVQLPGRIISRSDDFVHCRFELTERAQSALSDAISGRLEIPGLAA